MNWIEGTILILQLILIGGQLYLSYKINNQHQSTDKGYFVLHKGSKFYNLHEDIEFITSGQNDIIISGCTVEVNGIIKEFNSVPHEGFFTRDEPLNTLFFKFPLTNSDLKNDSISILFILDLKTPQDYKYTETIKIRFKKLTSESDNWEIDSFNIEFK